MAYRAGAWEPGLPLLEGEAGPLDADPFRQLLDHLLDGRHGITRTLAGAASPTISMAGDAVVALKTGEPKLQSVLAKAEKGTIWPALLRTYHSFQIFRVHPEGASACR